MREPHAPSAVRDVRTTDGPALRRTLESVTALAESVARLPLPAARG